MGLWSRTYVCCAVPLYNAGIYAILAQFTIIALVTGVLSFAAPSIVAVSIPSFGAYILGAICILVALFQAVGFFGVYRERPALFKTYARINTALVAAAFAVALAFIILSAARHSTAVNKCENLFASNTTTVGGAQVTTGNDICNIWTWVQIGIMGLLFLIVGLCEAYFLMFTSIYSSEQKLDHARYNSVYSTAAQEIRDSGLWSSDLPAPRGAGHERQQSGLRNEYYAGDDDDIAEEKMYAHGREERFDPPTQDYRGGYEQEIDEREYRQHYASQQQEEYHDPYQQQQPHQPQYGYQPQHQQQGESWDPAWRR